MNTIPLSTILEALPEEARLPFLEKVYRPERRDVAEAYLSELEPRAGDSCSKERGSFNKIIGNLIEQAGASGDTERVQELRFRKIVSYSSLGDIAKAATESADPVLIERVIAHYRNEYFNKAEMVMNLLEHLGRNEEARAYGLEAAQALRGDRSYFPARQVYLRLGMFQEAIDVELDRGGFDEAINLAQKHLREEDLVSFYRRVYAAAEGKGYDNGFPVQVRVAELLGDAKFARETKERYLAFTMENKAGSSLDLIREVGTAEQLRNQHEENVVFYQARYPRDFRLLAEVAEAAYKDTQEARYAQIAMEAYLKMADFPKVLEWARIADPERAAIFEKILELT